MLAELLIGTRKDDFRFILTAWHTLFTPRTFAPTGLRPGDSKSLIRAFSFFNKSAGLFALALTALSFVLPVKSIYGGLLLTARFYIVYILGVLTLFAVLRLVFWTKIAFRNLVHATLLAVGSGLIVVGLLHLVLIILFVTHPVDLSLTALQPVLALPGVQKICANTAIFECQVEFRQILAQAGDRGNELVFAVYFLAFAAAGVWIAWSMAALLNASLQVPRWKVMTAFLVQLALMNIYVHPYIDRWLAEFAAKFV